MVWFESPRRKSGIFFCSEDCSQRTAQTTICLASYDILGCSTPTKFHCCGPGEMSVKKIKINFDNTQNRFIFVLVNQLSYENKRR